MDNWKGAAYMALSMAAFTLEDALIKAIAVRLPVGEILILFGAGGAFIFACLAGLQKQSPVSRAMMSRTMLIRSFFEIFGRLFYALAIALSPLSSASAILQATPLVVAAGAVLFFHEQVGFRRWIAIAIGFCGVLMILRPGSGDFQLVSVFALLGMIGFAGRDLATRAAPASLGNLQLGILGFLMLVIAGGIATLYSQIWLMPTLTETLYLLVAIVIGVFAYNALTKAMRTGEIGVVAPFRYTRLVFAMIIGIWIFGEAPDEWTLAGSAIIVFSGLYTLIRSNKKPAPQ